MKKVSKIVLFIFTIVFTNQLSLFGSTADIFFSEYIEGSSYNKALEIFNGTGMDIDLSNYQLWQIGNGGNWPEYTVDISGILADGEVFVVCHPSANPAMLAVADLVVTLYHNGNDAQGLAKDDGTGTFYLIDTIGEDGDAPEYGWDVAGVTEATKDHTLVRKASIGNPNTDWNSSAGTNTDNSEWIVYPQDTFEYLGSHDIDGEDTTPPTITNVQAPSLITVEITFSEALNDTMAENKTNYTISPSLGITSAELQNGNTVLLSTEEQTEGETYSLTVMNIEDLHENVIVETTVVFIGYQPGEEEPDIYIDIDSLAFGNVTISDVSSIKSFYIFNQGNENLEIYEVSTPEAFEIKKGDAGDWVTNILDFIILDNSFQKIYVRFIPTVTGYYSGDISIYSNDPDEDTVYVNVSGTGVEYAVPNIEVDPTEVPFGNVTILSTKEEFFTISNIGTAELIIDSISVPVNSGFMIRSGDSGEYSNFISGFTISQGNEQIIYVEFIPQVVGYYSAYISISSNAGDGNDFVFVSGTGVEYDVPDIDVNPVELHFGGVPIYQGVEDTITIMNTGNAILEINDIYSLSGYEIKLDDGFWSNNIPPFDIPPAEEEIIYVKFHPEALITYNGVIYITSNDPDEGFIPVLVEGQGIPVLTEKIPDAFTPNGDGLNDEFIIGPFVESGTDEAQFKVYDLHGKMIHKTEGQANEALRWDGNNDSGNKCISGAYIYVYLINDKVYKRGKIYLIR